MLRILWKTMSYTKWINQLGIRSFARNKHKSQLIKDTEKVKIKKPPEKILTRAQKLREEKKLWEAKKSQLAEQQQKQNESKDSENNDDLKKEELKGSTDAKDEKIESIIKVEDDIEKTYKSKNYVIN